MKNSFFDFVQENYHFGKLENFKKTLFDAEEEVVKEVKQMKYIPKQNVSPEMLYDQTIQILDAIKMAEIDSFGAETFKYSIICTLSAIDCEKIESKNKNTEKELEF